MVRAARPAKQGAGRVQKTDRDNTKELSMIYFHVSSVLCLFRRRLCPSILSFASNGASRTPMTSPQASKQEDMVFSFIDVFEFAFGFRPDALIRIARTGNQRN